MEWLNYHHLLYILDGCLRRRRLACCGEAATGTAHHQRAGQGARGNYGNITFRAVFTERIVSGDLRESLQKSLKTSGNLRRPPLWWAHPECAEPSPCRV